MFWRSRAPGEGNCSAKFSLQTLAKKNKSNINENIGYKVPKYVLHKIFKKIKQDKRSKQFTNPRFYKSTD
jgi:hypothetical protein